MNKAENIDSELGETGSIELPVTFVHTLETAFEKTVREYHDNAVPSLDETKTAVFSSGTLEASYPYNESDLQTKITSDFLQLNGMGYDTMIVNIGTCYGMLALKELICHKRKGHIFRLICAKIRGELLEEPNLQVALLLADCECIIYVDDTMQYRDMVLSRVSYVSDEHGLAKI